MFQKARLKLTAWYLMIIMTVSIVFSLVIYMGIDRELGRFERLQETRLKNESELMLPNQLPRQFRTINLEDITSARERLIWTLIAINIGIFGIAGLTGYFLAGRTLRPIQFMVDEQNRFIADASHELRTPITALKSEIEVYFREKSHSIGEADSLLKSNLEEVNALQTLSDNLLELAQYQGSNGSISFEKVKLSEIITNALKKITPLAKEKQISIENKIHNEILTGNRQNLTQLLVILLENAVKYSPKKTTVTIKSKKTDHKISISVEDQGIGISKKDIPYVFDRFFRADTSRSKENVPGYGLGLSIAKKIVQAHNGTITVKSEMGKESVFSVTFQNRTV